jgi:hypothetical protein
VLFSTLLDGGDVNLASPGHTLHRDSWTPTLATLAEQRTMPDLGGTMSILRLQHLCNDGTVDTYHLKAGRRYHVGRGSACEVRVLDMKMSRRHVAFEQQGSEWLVHDLGSTNGAKVDGVRLNGSVAVDVGTRINMGATELVVVAIVNNDGTERFTDTAAVVQEPLPSDSSLIPAASEREIDDQADSDAAPSSVRIDLGEQNNALESEPHTAFKPTTDTTPRKPAAALETGVIITVLGQRIGPIDKAAARELKTRELKGELSAQDLDAYPQA